VGPLKDNTNVKPNFNHDTMKTFTLLFVLFTYYLLTTLTLHAQNSVSYTYDAAGRRVQRTIVLNPMAEKSALADSVNQKKKQVFEDNIGTQKVVIYPNPTQGRLLVEIQGNENITNSTLYLFDLLGKLLICRNLTNSGLSIDLSNYSNGTYILKIVIDDKTSQWKIMKE